MQNANLFYEILFHFRGDTAIFQCAYIFPVHFLPIVPGSREERGLTKWTASFDKDSPPSDMPENIEFQYSLKSYNIPVTKQIVHKLKWARYVPVCPTYGSKPVALSISNSNAKKTELLTK